MQSIDFINNNSLIKLFGSELELLQQALEMSRGKDIFIIEFSHKEVFRNLAFQLAYRLVSQGLSVYELMLNEKIPFPEFVQSEGIVFLYSFIENPCNPAPTTFSEPLVKRLNRARETLAHSDFSLILWIYSEHLAEFQRFAPDLWAAKRGLYSFVLPTDQSIKSLSLSSELSPADLAELAQRAIRWEKELAVPNLSIKRKLKLHEQAGRLWDRIGLASRAHSLFQQLQILLVETNDLESLRQSYLQRLAEKLEWSDFKGIRQLKIIVKLRLKDLFVTLRFRRQFKEKTHLSRELSNQTVDAANKNFGKSGQVLAVKPFDPLPREQVVDFKEIFRSSKIVVLGDPGSGKSTLLKYLAYKLAREAVSELPLSDVDKLLLPILISAADYSNELRRKEISFAQFLDQKDPTLWTVFEEALRNGKALVMIDGLDEEVQPKLRIRTVRRIEAFAAQYSGNRILVTSRSAGYSIAPLSFGFEHFTIEPFDEQAIHSYLKNWYSSLYRESGADSNQAEIAAKSLFQAITDQPQLQRLASNPLLLTIMVLIHYQGARLPYRRVELYWQIVDALAETWNLVRNISGRSVDLWLGTRRLDRSLVERILSPIAFQVHRNNPGGLVPGDVLIQQIAGYFVDYEGKNKGDAENLAVDFLKLAQEQIGILTERGMNQFAFTHLTLEEYLAAHHLAGLENPGAEACKRLYNPRFEEVLLLTAALLRGQHSENFIKSIYHYQGELDRLLQRSLLLAARSLADEVNVSFGLKKEIIDRLLALFGEQQPDSFLSHEIRQVLVAFKGSTLEATVIHELVLAFQSNAQPGLRSSAIQALGAIGSPLPEVSETLLKAMKDEDWLVRAGAAEAFGEMGQLSKEVVQALINSLCDQSKEVRAFSAAALGELNQPSAEVVDALTGMLRDEASLVRANSAVALMQLRVLTPAVPDTLMNGLQDEESLTRVISAWALAELGRTRDDIVTALIYGLRDKNKWLCASSAVVLGELGQSMPDAVSALLEGLKDDKSCVRAYSAEALGESGQAGPQVIEALSKCLQDEVSRVRVNSAAALSKLGQCNSEIPDVLIRGMHDKEWSVRGNSAQALGRLNQASPKVLAALNRGLKDEDWSVRGNSAEALGESGAVSPGIIKALLRLVLRDKEEYVRAAAARALGQLKITSPKILKKLMKAANYGNDAALEALWEIALFKGNDRLKGE